MEGISSKAAGRMDNHKKFVGQEFDVDLGVNLYEFKWRHHDPQIGRFIEIDPLADNYVSNSTYAYAENKPISGIDLEGLEFYKKTEGKCVTISISTMSVNKTSRVGNEYIKAVNNYVNKHLSALFSQTDSKTGTSYTANYSSAIVANSQKEDTKNGIVVNFVDFSNDGENGHTQYAPTGDITVGVLNNSAMHVDSNTGKIVPDDCIKDITETGETIAHEVLHKLGLFHPWEAGNPDDIAQYNFGPDGCPLTRTNVSDDTIIYNALNSGGNIDLNLGNTTNRNGLTMGQIKIADKVAEETTTKTKTTAASATK